MSPVSWSFQTNTSPAPEFKMSTEIHTSTQLAPMSPAQLTSCAAWGERSSFLFTWEETGVKVSQWGHCGERETAGRQWTYFMEGRCRSTTSTAWTGLVLIGLSSSRGSGKVLPVKTSCSKCQLTRETNFIDTLKGRSFPPSPGSVTSKSTWVGEEKKII